MTQLAGHPIPVACFDPSATEVQRDPYPYYHWLLRNDPVHRGVNGIWFVSRYDDVRAVLAEDRLVRQGIRDFWSQLVGPGPLSGILSRTVLFQDEPDHSRLRALVMPAFAPRALRSLVPEIDRLVDELVDPSAGELDVINDVAYPLALGVISAVLGLPAKDRDLIRAWSLRIGPTLDLAAGAGEIADGQAAMAELTGYLADLIRVRRGSGDLLGTLVADGSASREEVIAMVVTLIFAGHETVTNQIGNGVLALARHPAQLSLLRALPDLIPDAVEEMLRFDSSVQSNSRQLVDDLELRGRTLRRGELVVALMGAANRDPERFADPDRFDVTRTGVHPLSFGSGMRHCVGAVLARLELAAVFRALVRLPDWTLTRNPEELQYQRSTMFRGVLTLPIAFTAQKPRSTP
ncbi:cytochrome P450 [Lentzea flaviverrucosa]|uniref:Cytochrome P450 n=1 Tax=Lentzea flaviverrucosa TaxID=200379 RepID=A0A1H9HLU1_9PSEU|nr:cytochrome P450 [Lentzea flaviverrucosa]RDI34545.1 cytochrome P450 [Lentzea flaviverrucosa]SEQ63321.1 Cytochrome P450 [Lentzea flaviverrucosa]